jgi:hypothetical protein
LIGVALSVVQGYRSSHRVNSLERRLAPRSILPDERARMISELSKREFAGVPAGACSPRGAMLPDIVPLAKAINSILTAAGWHALDWAGDCPAEYGIVIQGSGAQNCRAPIEALAKALPAELGPHIHFRYDLPSTPCPNIIIFIGIPSQGEGSP